MLDGLAWRVVPEKVGFKGLPGVNIDVTDMLLTGGLNFNDFMKEVLDDGLLPDSTLFRYRGVFDNRVYKDLTHQKLLRNYASVSFRLAIKEDNLHMKEKAADHLLVGKEFLKQMERPFSNEIIKQLIAVSARVAALKREMGKYREAIAILREGLTYAKVPAFYTEIAENYLELGDTTRALQEMKIAWDLDPTIVNYRRLAKLYLNVGDTLEARKILEGGLKLYPNDTLAKEILNRLKT
jgi:tetratricopeptide (TPR) repeat protein